MLQCAPDAPASDDRRQRQREIVPRSLAGPRPAAVEHHVRRNPEGVYRADHRPHAGPGDQVDGNAGLLERPEHADMREAASASARQREPDGPPGEQPGQARVIGDPTRTDVMVAHPRPRRQPGVRSGRGATRRLEQDEAAAGLASGGRGHGFLLQRSRAWVAVSEGHDHQVVSLAKAPRRPGRRRVVAKQHDDLGGRIVAGHRLAGRGRPVEESGPSQSGQLGHEHVRERRERDARPCCEERDGPIGLLRGSTPQCLLQTTDDGTGEPEHGLRVSACQPIECRLGQPEEFGVARHRHGGRASRLRQQRHLPHTLTRPHFGDHACRTIRLPGRHAQSPAHHEPHALAGVALPHQDLSGRQGLPRQFALQRLERGPFRAGQQFGPAQPRGGPRAVGPEMPGLGGLLPPVRRPRNCRFQARELRGQLPPGRRAERSHHGRLHRLHRRGPRRAQQQCGLTHQFAGADLAQTLHRAVVARDQRAEPPSQNDVETVAGVPLPEERLAR